MKLFDAHKKCLQLTQCKMRPDNIIPVPPASHAAYTGGTDITISKASDSQETHDTKIN